MNEELNALRDQIDAVDQQLVALLAQRLALVAEVGEVKSRHGLPIYAPDREAAMLAKRRAEATAKGVPADLIEDVLRRVMRESYSSENDSGFKCVRPELRSIVVIGGAGQDACSSTCSAFRAIRSRSWSAMTGLRPSRCSVAPAWSLWLCLSMPPVR